MPLSSRKFVNARTTWSGGETDETRNGSLTVRQSLVGDDYVLIFEGTSDSGAVVTARYRGPVTASFDIDTGNGPVPDLPE